MAIRNADATNPIKLDRCVSIEARLSVLANFLIEILTLQVAAASTVIDPSPPLWCEPTYHYQRWSFLQEPGHELEFLHRLYLATLR